MSPLSIVGLKLEKWFSMWGRLLVGIAAIEKRDTEIFFEWFSTDSLSLSDNLQVANRDPDMFLILALAM